MQLRNGKKLGWAEVYLNLKTVPFWAVHIAAIVGIIQLGFSWSGVALAALLYVPRMFFVTAGYHRYFSHRSYRTSRVFQFLLAFGAVATAQKGVMWWASHHRKHHRFSDEPQDLHSPRDGFWWSHMGWILSYENEGTDLSGVPDLVKYPELRLLERFWLAPPILVAVATYALGGYFALVWGFFVAQVVLWHGTFTINSLSHVIGWRRFETTDDSRNHLGLALLTLGEGWHNNHHHRPGVARQGIGAREIDISYAILRVLAVFGVVWDLREKPVTKKVRVGTAVETNPAGEMALAQASHPAAEVTPTPMPTAVEVATSPVRAPSAAV
ncbi:MAG TPA: acyl-CoA desaturase [Polyangia bacterium]